MYWKGINGMVEDMEQMLQFIKERNKEVMRSQEEMEKKFRRSSELKRSQGNCAMLIRK